MAIARNNPTRADRAHAQLAENARIIFANSNPISSHANQTATTIHVFPARKANPIFWLEIVHSRGGCATRTAFLEPVVKVEHIQGKQRSRKIHDQDGRATLGGRQCVLPWISKMELSDFFLVSHATNQG